MAATSRERELIRTTLYIVSPALAAAGETRSLLYSASHNHLFRGGAD
jgi:precorrin-4/cobalt-precorrin-4 C11-methyltransferase